MKYKTILVVIIISICGCNSNCDNKDVNTRDEFCRLLSKNEFNRIYKYHPENLEFYNPYPDDYIYRVDSVKHKTFPLTKYLIQSSHRLPRKVIVFDTTDTYYLGYGFSQIHDQELVDNFCQVKDSLSCYKATELILWIRTPFPSHISTIMPIDSTVKVEDDIYKSYYTFMDYNYCLNFINGKFKLNDSLFITNLTGNKNK